jgi:hypothetical protein
MLLIHTLISLALKICYLHEQCSYRRGIWSGNLQFLKSIQKNDSSPSRCGKLRVTIILGFFPLSPKGSFFKKLSFEICTLET